MSNERPPIPAATKRAVRQRCGFGCIICGMPLIEYDHMVEYSDNKNHDADNITLLCDFHHRQKTNGLITREFVQESNSSPFNIINNHSSPYQQPFQGDQFNVKIGNTQFIAVNTPRTSLLKLNGEEIISVKLEDGIPYLSLKIYDQEYNLILQIQDNEIVLSKLPFDFSFEGRTITIKSAMRNVLIEIEICPPNGIMIKKGRLYGKDSKIEIYKDRLEVDTPMVAKLIITGDSSFAGKRTGFSI